MSTSRKNVAKKDDVSLLEDVIFLAIPSGARSMRTSSEDSQLDRRALKVQSGLSVMKFKPSRYGVGTLWGCCSGFLSGR